MSRNVWRLKTWELNFEIKLNTAREMVERTLKCLFAPALLQHISRVTERWKKGGRRRRQGNIKIYFVFLNFSLRLVLLHLKCCHVILTSPWHSRDNHCSFNCRSMCHRKTNNLRFECLRMTVASPSVYQFREIYPARYSLVNIVEH